MKTISSYTGHDSVRTAGALDCGDLSPLSRVATRRRGCAPDAAEAGPDQWHHRREPERSPVGKPPRPKSATSRRTPKSRWLRAIGALLLLSGLTTTVRAQAASAGLWVGTVSLNQVTDPKAALTPAGGTFEFRILFHVSTAGTVKLLKDVIVMQRDDDNNPATAPVIALVTDPARIPNYSGVLRRSDGRLTGLRYAASAYDFTGFDHATVGEIAAEKTLEYTLETSENSPANPFRHKFHPDHEKGRAYTRVVTVNFKGATAADTSTGTKRITGTYKEVIKNLLKYDIQMAGTLTLDRVSTAGALNP